MNAAILILAAISIVLSNANSELLRQRPEGRRGWPALIGGLAGVAGVLILFPRIIEGQL